MPYVTRERKIVYRPVLKIKIEGIEKKMYNFIVDSGADISVSPRYISDKLKIDWESGISVKMSGIAKKEECIVVGRIHDINILIPDIGLTIKIPICFSEEDAPFLLGREGFMDYFDITFKKKDKETLFELREQDVTLP